MTNYLHKGQKVTLSSGKKGVITALDFEQGKIVSAAVEVDEGPHGPQTYHKRADEIQA